ncbi:MAG: hypothetical protein K5911_04430 [Eubacteriales bacterium]|nr:hypothetical protein [Eubacteriales bacterium]
MISRLRTFWHRLKNASFRRMFTYIEEIHKESGKSRILTFIDMCFCILRYGVGYLEYRVFGFAYIKGAAKRRTFMNMTENKKLIAALNNPEKSQELFEDKAGFLREFDDYAKRRWLDLRTADDSQLNEFLDQTDIFFAKPMDDYGGHGVTRYVKSETDRSTLRKELEEKKLELLEEGIRQHEKLNELNSSSINTLRMVTVVDREGAPHLIYTIMRIGRAGSVVDNVSSGGLYTRVRDDGTLCANTFCDATGSIMTTHPDTGVVFGGFAVPNYEDAKAMCLEAALKVPEVRYVGWDVAITPDGPCIVEGNPMPSYDMIQNYAFQDGSGKGILTEFKKYI